MFIFYTVLYYNLCFSSEFIVRVRYIIDGPKRFRQLIILNIYNYIILNRCVGSLRICITYNE